MNSASQVRLWYIGGVNRGCLVRKAVLPGLCLLFAAAPARGRKHSAHASSSQTVLRVTTHLVQVNVIVKDGRGHLVDGLTRGDFQVFDDGKPQNISAFQVEETQPASVLPARLPRGVFTNLWERQSGESPAITVILLDSLNTDWAAQAWSRMKVIEFLRQIQPGDRVALYALGTRLQVLHDFTTDASALVQALAHYHGRLTRQLKMSAPPRPASSSSPSDSGLDASAAALEPTATSTPVPEFAGRGRAEETALVQWLADIGDAQAEFYLDQRVEMTVDALAAIANHLEGVPGRKNLIWVSSGFPALALFRDILKPGGIRNVTNYTPVIARAARALNNANLAIYPLDARGLLPNLGLTTLQPAMLLNDQNLMPSSNFDTMDILAQRTGGVAFYNTNDLKGAIREVLDDSRLTYALAYYPENGKWDGEYRRITVKVDRPGLQLQYRRGYAALPEEPPSAPKGDESLVAAALSPLDATGVGVIVRAAPVPSVRGEAHVVRIECVIAPRDITLLPERNGWKAKLTVMTDELGSRGESLKATSDKLSAAVNPSTRPRFLASGVSFTDSLSIVHNAERIRIVVRDDPSGRMGSVNVPLSRPVPPPSDSCRPLLTGCHVL